MPSTEKKIKIDLQDHNYLDLRYVYVIWSLVEGCLISNHAKFLYIDNDKNI